MTVTIRGNHESGFIAHAPTETIILMKISKILTGGILTTLAAASAVVTAPFANAIGGDGKPPIPAATCRALSLIHI